MNDFFLHSIVRCFSFKDLFKWNFSSNRLYSTLLKKMVRSYDLQWPKVRFIIIIIEKWCTQEKYCINNKSLFNPLASKQMEEFCFVIITNFVDQFHFHWIQNKLPKKIEFILTEAVINSNFNINCFKKTRSSFLFHWKYIEYKMILCLTSIFYFNFFLLLD